MRYTLLVQQKRAIEWGLNLPQSILFSFLFEVPTWAESCEIEGKRYYHCSRFKVIDEVPLVAKKPDSVYRLFCDLSAFGVIEYVKDSKKDWIRITEKGSDWNKSNSEKNPNNDENSEKNPKKLGKKSENNSEKNPTDNIIIDNKKENYEVVAPNVAKKTKSEIAIEEIETDKANRKKDFEKSLMPFLGKYDKTMLRNFADYWTESNYGKKKMRFQNETFFDIPRRLATWYGRSKESFSKPVVKEEVYKMPKNLFQNEGIDFSEAAKKLSV